MALMELEDIMVLVGRRLLQLSASQDQIHLAQTICFLGQILFTHQMDQKTVGSDSLSDD